VSAAAGKRRKILFVSGTRADYGKTKTLIAAVDAKDAYECIVFATGMHTLEQYGYTINELEKAGHSNLFAHINQTAGEPMELILANTVDGLSRFVEQRKPDLIVVHGDRVETLAGAIVGALRNILVAHIEGGEISGTVDELIRHSVSKLAHLHFVANDEAQARVCQMGERPDSVFVIGSPDMDVMVSDTLPGLDETKKYYGLLFDDYAIAVFHPVTTELETLPDQARNFVDALIESGRDYVVVYPNNDAGTSFIMNEYRRLRGNPRFRVFPSIRFEFFLTLLKNALYMVGNSSAGVREAPFYGRPSVNVGTRQQNRFSHVSIFNTAADKDAIVDGMERALAAGAFPAIEHFGRGDSMARFMEILESNKIWDVSRQKQFVDIPPTPEGTENERQ